MANSDGATQVDESTKAAQATDDIADTATVGRDVPDNNNAVIEACRAFLANGSDASFRQASAAIADSKYSSDHAVEALQILYDLQNDDYIDLRARLTEMILKDNRGRKALIHLITESPSTAFMHIWRFGGHARAMLLQTCLSPESWTENKQRAKVHKDVFLLLLSILIQPGDNPDRDATSLQAIAQLLTIDPAHVETLIDNENLTILLSFLDIQRPVIVRSQATLVTARFLEASKERGQSMLASYVTSKITRQNNDDVVAAFSTAGAIFPILPDVASRLFLTSGFVEDLSILVRKSHSKRLRTSALELLSAACINKDCRQVIRGICTPWLEDVVINKYNERDTALSALVLSKTCQEKTEGVPELSRKIDSTDLVQLYTEIIAQSDSTEVQIAFEGLAYSSTQSSVKDNLSKNQVLLKNLLKVMQKRATEKPLIFGGLTIFSNLCTYPPELSAEQKRMAQLKAYANQSRPAEPDPLDQPDLVSRRCKIALDNGIAPALKKAAVGASPTSLILISSIVLNLSKDRKNRGTMLQQGITDLILPIASYAGSNLAMQQAQKAMAQTLARCMISVDPALVFRQSSTYSLKNVLASLRILLDDRANADPRPAFEALQALTNLASMDSDVCEQISQMMFSSVEYYFSSPFSAQQQAAIECISNLSIAEACVRLFVVDKDTTPIFPTQFNGESEHLHVEESRFLNVRALTTDSVRGTRLAAAATLFNITLSFAGVRMLLSCPAGVERLLDQLPISASETSKADLDDSSPNELDIEMLTRIVGVLLNIVQIGGKEARTRMTALNLESRLASLQSFGIGGQLLAFVDEIRQNLSSA